TAETGTRAASASPAPPMPAPRSTATSPGSAGQAAASRTASWPTRCPRLGCRSRKRPPRIASSVIPSVELLTIGAQLVTETGIHQQFAGFTRAILSDHHTTRQHAERAFEHAHVLVEHHMFDARAAQQRLDRSDQHGIVGANDFAHLN